MKVRLIDISLPLNSFAAKIAVFSHCHSFNYTYRNKFSNRVPASQLQAIQLNRKPIPMCPCCVWFFFHFLLQMDKTNVQRKKSCANIINCPSSLYKNVYWFWICVFMMCIVVFMIFNGVCFYLITFNATWCACECIFIAVNHIKNK